MDIGHLPLAAVATIIVATSYNAYLTDTIVIFI